MNIEKLEYLLEVARTGSYSAAAQNLHVSQSGISQSILNVEKELGVKIFHRSRQGVIPTDEGKKVIRSAYEILNKFQELKDEINPDVDKNTGELKISTAAGFIKALLKPLASIKNENPSVNIEVSEKSTLNVIEDIVQEQSEIGLIGIYGDVIKNRDGIICEILLEGKMAVYVNNQSPLVFFESITPQELLKQPLLLYNGDYLKWFTHNFQEKHGPLNIVFTTNETDVIIKAALEGLGIFLAPNFYSKLGPNIKSGEIVPIDLVNHESLSVSFGLIRSKKRSLSLHAKTFIKALKLELETILSADVGH
ncbi:LysR family transcriptional regulator [Neobacillus drentensis]|uniref:LysR family transcriptional regulator n=1 Tax=Neobacillus drentensis TaxID=220684 RepID=UPI002FFE964F